LIAPPFTINSQLIGMLVEGVERAVADLEKLHVARLGGSSAHN
jgi:hypothetical protein